MTELLQRTQAEINAIQQQLKHIERTGGFAGWFKEPRLRKKLRNLESQQFYQIDDYLNSSSEEYKKVVMEIHELLEIEQIIFTVYTKGFSFIGSHTTRIEGVIHPNGYSYSEAVGQNINWFPFDSFLFPSQMSGNIDHWGRIKLRKTKSDHALFRRVPRKLTGTISKKGEVQLEVTEHDMDDPFDGRLTMGKLIANHFNYSEQKNNEFQIRKNYLIEAIDQFKTDRIADSKGYLITKSAAI
ncbi:MAG: hypothetical protein RLO17_09560 [Cyclobacteriaceae bacterium]